MATAYLGMFVQVTADPDANNGRNRTVAVVTSVNGNGPNGGLLINVVAFPDAGVAAPYGGEDVELFDYDSDARTLPDGAGAWPLDYA